MSKPRKKQFSPKIDETYMPNATQEVLSQSVAELKILEATIEKLDSVGIKTIFDVARIEMKHLYDIEGMSKKDVFAVMRGLHALGLDFKRNPKKVEDSAGANQGQSSDTVRNSDPSRQNNPNIAKNDNRNDNRPPQGNRPDNRNDNRQPQGNRPLERERINTHDMMNGGNGRVERERVSSRDFDRSSKNRSNPRESEREKKTRLAAKKPPIILPPLVIEDGLYKFFNSGKWGYKDDKGAVMITPQFDEAFNFAQGMAAVEVNERIGFINKTGEIAITPQFDTACSFTEGLASVTLGERSGYVDQEGTLVHPMEYESATPFVNGSALVKKDGKWHFLSRETGELRPR